MRETPFASPPANQVVTRNMTIALIRLFVIPFQQADSKVLWTQAVLHQAMARTSGGKSLHPGDPETQRIAAYLIAGDRSSSPSRFSPIAIPPCYAMLGVLEVRGTFRRRRACGFVCWNACHRPRARVGLWRCRDLRNCATAKAIPVRHVPWAKPVACKVFRSGGPAYQRSIRGFERLLAHLGQHRRPKAIVTSHVSFVHPSWTGMADMA